MFQHYKKKQDAEKEIEKVEKAKRAVAAAKSAISRKKIIIMNKLQLGSKKKIIIDP